MLGDGYVSSKVRTQNNKDYIQDTAKCCTISKQLADDLVQLAVMCGFGAYCYKA